jgi:hypothetical protein
MLNWRRFTPNDWYSMGGAASFERTASGINHNEEPFTADMLVDGLDAMVILDGYDIAIYLNSDDRETYFIPPEDDRERYRPIADGHRDLGHWISMPLRLLPEMSTEQLLNLGFVERPI